VNGATELLVAEALERLEGRSAAFALAPMRGIDRLLDPRARRLGHLLALTIRGFDRRYGFRAIARYEAPASCPWSGGRGTPPSCRRSRGRRSCGRRCAT